MVALRARRLVWAATAWMRPTTCPILEPLSASEETAPAICEVILLARSTIPVAVEIWRPISPIEAFSSSEAEATDWTMVEVSSAAAAAEVAWVRAPVAIEARVSAVPSMRLESPSTTASRLVEAVRKLATSCSTWAATRVRSSIRTS